MDRPQLQKIDDVIHAKARLGIMSLLMTYGESDFPFLKKKLGLSDGNLGSHLRKLEESDYVRIEKKFVDRKPKTICQTTPKGEEAYKGYIQALEQLIYMLPEDEDKSQSEE